MSDISQDKIKNLLSDPKSIEMIASLISTMGVGSKKASPTIENSNEADITDHTEALPVMSQSKANESTPTSVLSSLPNLPFDGMGGGISTGHDRRIDLLRAIKPYVNDSKKERVDGLVKAISVATILNRL